jgi:hypothetical protein
VPSNTNEWIFWVFTTLIVGTIVGIGVNLITPKVKEGGQSWIQKARLKDKEYRDSLNLWCDKLDNHPHLVYLYLLTRYSLASIFIVLGSLLLIMMRTSDRPEPLIMLILVGIFLMLPLWTLTNQTLFVLDLYHAYRRRHSE